ncbi:Hypp8555 [Branchiostoma lanceolatum]|uniref:Hypp8555 protein n=1 Tax=Branchiostoma lanceolatum TaxID=7740 RepID=A0A8J9Z8D9_BRALA|nr:Hypp8555 [Branchiostoma lanceolatum]
MRTNNRRRLIHRLLAIFQAVPAERQPPCRTRPWWTGRTAPVAVNTESDKPAEDIAHLCKHAWEDVSTVKVALQEHTTLQIVPMGVDKSCNPQIIAIVLSDVISSENITKSYADRHSTNVSAFDLEEMTNVTCLVNTWEETYRHVFTLPLSSTPDGTVCAEKTQATRTVMSSTPDGSVCTREGITLTTREPNNIKTTKLTLNKTNPSTNGTVKEKSPLVAIVIMVAVVGVVLVALFVAYVIRRQHCCSQGDQAVDASQGPSSSGDEPQYCEIPDEYYDQQNTAASTTSQTGITERSPLVAILTVVLGVVLVVMVALLVTYVIKRQGCCSKGDQPTQSDITERYPILGAIIAVTMVSVVGVVLVALFVAYVIRRQRCCSKGDQAAQAVGASQGPSSPQYCEIPDEYYDQQNAATLTTSQIDNDYSQIPDEYFNYYNTRPGAQHPYWQIPDEYYNRYNTYPLRLRVPKDDKDYSQSVRFNATTAEVALPSSARQGGKHPSYSTAPQVWRDPQNYQIPALGRQTNIRSHQYMGLIGNRRPLSYPLTLRVPQDYEDYSVRFKAASAEVALPLSARQGGKHPSYSTAPQVWRDPQNYQIPARGRNTNIRSHRMPVSGSSSVPRYMGLISNYSKTMRAAKFRMQTMALYNRPPAQPSRLQHSTENQAAFKSKPSENKIIQTCQQASVSQGDVLATCKSEGKGQVHRSKTLGMNVSKLKKDESTKKASHHRQSI